MKRPSTQASRQLSARGRADTRQTREGLKPARGERSKTRSALGVERAARAEVAPIELR